MAVIIEQISNLSNKLAEWIQKKKQIFVEKQEMQTFRWFSVLYDHMVANRTHSEKKEKARNWPKKCQFGFKYDLNALARIGKIHWLHHNFHFAHVCLVGVITVFSTLTFAKNTKRFRFFHNFFFVWQNFQFMCAGTCVLEFVERRIATKVKLTVAVSTEIE